MIYLDKDIPIAIDENIKQVIKELSKKKKFFLLQQISNSIKKEQIAKIYEKLGINYELFSYDKDLKYSNLDQFSFDLNVNNFYTNISYYSEHNDLPDEQVFQKDLDLQSILFVKR